METGIKVGRKLREQKIKAIIEKLDKADALVFNDYRGLTVSQISVVRKTLREKGASMHVHKNRLIKHAVRQKQYDSAIEAYFSGPTAITYIKGDVSPVLKDIFRFINDQYPLAVRGAYVDNAVLNAEDSEKLSKLPNREELLAILMVTLNAPVQCFAITLNDVIVKFVRVLDAISQGKK